MNNRCYDCGYPIEPNKPHYHRTFVVIRGEPQAVKDGFLIGSYMAGDFERINVFVVEPQEKGEEDAV